VSNFAIRPRRYHDQLDAIWACLDAAKDKGRVISPERNPNGKLEMLVWAHNEIIRLRKLVGEPAPDHQPIATE
jgi:hypothetical protein